jgi:1,4-dihydroxy-2-naphthoate octaprenyltransferase
MDDDARSTPPAGWRLWLAGARPRTLPAAIVPVLVGTACAAGELPAIGGDGWFNHAPNAGAVIAGATGGFEAEALDLSGPLKGIVIWRFVAALVVALAIQVGTNFANDYSDGKRGTDGPDRVGPLRLVGSGLVSADRVKAAAIGSFAVAGVAGLGLAAVTSWWLLLVGAVSFAAGWLYTGGPRPYGYAGLGEVFVFVFFGLVATIGSTFVQLERVTWLSVAAAVPVGMLATALLVINNLRDVDTDAAVGKRTLATKVGDRATRVLYTVLLVGAVATVPLIAGISGRWQAAVALFAILLAPKPLLAVWERRRGAALLPALGQTGRMQLVFGILLAAGLFLGGDIDATIRSMTQLG